MPPLSSPIPLPFEGVTDGAEMTRNLIEQIEAQQRVKEGRPGVSHGLKPGVDMP